MTNLSPSNRNIHIATHPPKWVAFPQLWEDLVLDGAHTTYGAAVAHYRAHQTKHGILTEQRKGER